MRSRSTIFWRKRPAFRRSAFNPGNGSNELLMYLPALSGAKRALIVTPGYLEYEPACRRAGLKVEYFPLRSEDGFALSPEELEQSVRPGDLVIVGNPGNPT